MKHSALFTTVLLGGCALSSVDESTVQDDVIIGSIQSSAHFGASIVRGDFNCDHIDDLAVGAPGEGPGAVFLYKGTASGLVPWRRIDENQLPLPDGAVSGDGFGTTLAAGDIDGDHCAELVVSAPASRDAQGRDSGAVFVLAGSVDGPEPGVAQRIAYNAATLVLHTEHPAFLAMGNPFGGTAGQVRVDAADLSQPPGHMFSTFATIDAPELCCSSGFGTSIAIADFDGDGHRDLAIGDPQVNGNSFGMVWAYRGSGHDFGAAIEIDEQTLVPKGDDAFGMSLAVGRFDGTGDNELVITSEAIDHGAGRVFLYKPTLAGGVLTGMHSVQGFALTNGSPFDPNKPPPNPIAVGDINGDGIDDMVVGSPTANLVHVLLGASGGVNSHTTLGWGPTTGSNAWEIPGGGDGFGTAVALGHFGTGVQLVTGMPFHDEHVDAVNTATDSGAIIENPELAGTLFPLGRIIDADTN